MAMALAVAHKGLAPTLPSLTSASVSPSYSVSVQWRPFSAPLSRSRGPLKLVKILHSVQEEDSKSLFEFFAAPARRSWTKMQSRGWICMAMDASIGGSEPAQPVFPRLNVRDPYKRLGVGRDASEEEIREARNFLSSQYNGHERSRESIESAYDKIIMESFRDRKKSKINLKSNLKKKVSESPAWVRNLANMVEVPSSTVIGQRAALFALLGVWSVFNPAEGGPAFQVAVSLAACIYFLNDRLKSLGRAFIIGRIVGAWLFESGDLETARNVAAMLLTPSPRQSRHIDTTFSCFAEQHLEAYVLSLLIAAEGNACPLWLGALVVGWVLGSFIVPVLPSRLLPRTWSLELTTSLISYVFLWVACTFLK